MDRKLLFPLALALAWVLAVGYSVADLARFDGTARAAKVAELRELAPLRPQARSAPRHARLD